MSIYSEYQTINSTISLQKPIQEDIKKIWTGSQGAGVVTEPFIYKLFDKLELSEKYEKFKSQLEERQKELQAKNSAKNTSENNCSRACCQRHSETIDSIKHSIPIQADQQLSQANSSQAAAEQQNDTLQFATEKEEEVSSSTKNLNLIKESKNKRKKKRHFLKKKFQIKYIKEAEQKIFKEDFKYSTDNTQNQQNLNSNHEEQCHNSIKQNDRDQSDFLSHHSTESDIDKQIDILSYLEDEEDDKKIKNSKSKQITETLTTPTVPQHACITPIPFYMVYVMNTNRQLVPQFISSAQYASILQAKPAPLPCHTTPLNMQFQQTPNNLEPKNNQQPVPLNTIVKDQELDLGQNKECVIQQQASENKPQQSHTEQLPNQALAEGLYFDKDNDNIVSTAQYFFQHQKDRAFSDKEVQRKEILLMTAPPNLTQHRQPIGAFSLT